MRRCADRATTSGSRRRVNSSQNFSSGHPRRVRRVGIGDNSGCALSSASNTAQTPCDDRHRSARARSAAGRRGRPASRTDTPARKREARFPVSIGGRCHEIRRNPRRNAGDLAGLAILAIANHRSIRLQFEQIDVERFVHGRCADRGRRVHQIPRHLGLAIDGDGPAVSALKSMRCLEPSRRSLSRRERGPRYASAGRAGLLDQPDRALVEYARANPTEHVVLRLLLQDDRFDFRPWPATARAADPKDPSR